MSSFADVIAAISTPPGKGGVSVIRMSGNGSLEIAERVFTPKSKRPIRSYGARIQIWGDISSSDGVIDDGLLTYFPEGSSYTGEETVEISCHGGVLVTRCVLEALFTAGARPAGKGEFTKRAYINGKISLMDAEAIGNLLEARSVEQIKLSSSGARDALDERILEIRRSLTESLGSLYARIDYPDEDLGDFTDEELCQRLKSAQTLLSRLIATYRTGRAITEGIPTVICGKPNVGKSTLYNLLLGEDAAIVTDISGTTRDLLERSVPLGRVMLNLADTAGIRESSDKVEKIGIERSIKRIDESELILALFDISRELDGEDEKILSMLKSSSAAKIAILNKSDIADAPILDRARIDEIFDDVLIASAAKDDGSLIASLSATVDRLFTDERIKTGDDAIVASARQHAALVRASEQLSLAIGALESGIYQDAVSSDVERALGALAEIDGRAVSEEVVGDIFSRFCVGK